jgi:hypothetical protein
MASRRSSSASRSSKTSEPALDTAIRSWTFPKMGPPTDNHTGPRGCGLRDLASPRTSHVADSANFRGQPGLGGLRFDLRAGWTAASQKTWARSE